MRNLKFFLGVAAALVAFAAYAAPSMASEFRSSGGTITGKGEEQEFSLGPFQIECAKAKVAGQLSEPYASATLFNEIKLKGCRTEALLPKGGKFTLKTKFETPVDVEYHANGWVELGGESEEGEGELVLKGDSVQLTVPALKGEHEKCVVTWPEQTLPTKAEKKPEKLYEEAEFFNEELEVGKNTYMELEIDNAFKRIHFSYAGGQCAEFKSTEEELHSGRYTGEFIEGIKKGNLEFVETEV